MDEKTTARQATQALVRAARCGDQKALRQGLKAGADADGHGESVPLILAANRGLGDCVELLIQAGADVENTAGAAKQTALIAAAESESPGAPECVRLLVKAGANLEASERHRGRSALMVSAWLGQEQIVELLIQAGAVLNAVDDGGATAEDLARRYGQSRCVGLLRAAAERAQLRSGAAAPGIVANPSSLHGPATGRKPAL